MHDIALEQELIIVSVDTIHKLFSLENGSDVVALYMFYHKQCKMQGTNQSWSTGSFVMQGLGWGDSRFGIAKKALKELGLVEDIRGVGEDGKVTKWYIKLNYIKTTTSSSTRVVEPGGGFQGTNAGSSLNINAGSSKKEMLSVQEVKIAVKDKDSEDKKSLSLTAKEELFEKFWNICKIHSRKADAKKKFLKLTIKECELCITAMSLYNKMKEAKKDPAKFYKVPANWIEEKMFEDEVIVEEITEDEKYDYRRSDSSKEKNDIISKYNPEFASLRAKGKQDDRTQEENARCVEIIKEFEAKYSLEHVFDFGI